jgi:Gram-negative bacterial TonB protein C-terminal
VLPAGLAEAILAKTRCTDSWLGVVKATVDRAGRVQSLDVRNAGVGGRCEDALQAMLRLSLAEPAKITSPLETANLVTVKPRNRAVCMDETAPENVLRRRGLSRVGGAVSAPKARKRVEPYFPERVRRELPSNSFALTMESVITSQGCVRDIRLLTQSPWPELNGASVVALAEWTFEPGRIDGVPVDVLFNLTINYKLR